MKNTITTPEDLFMLIHDCIWKINNKRILKKLIELVSVENKLPFTKNRFIKEMESFGQKEDSNLTDFYLDTYDAVVFKSSVCTLKLRQRLHELRAEL